MTTINLVYSCNDCESHFVDDSRAYDHAVEEKHCVHDNWRDADTSPCNGFCKRWDH